ncbi:MULTISPECIES: transcriptional regulator NanR [Ensifer]|jgi:DNA-binding FadR family transcriptional regulator|uniref:transcriptional regulator NanR n=1 Tax=Ensifer TaxID=106591 RepID=UPI00071605B2|nr:MULTISPECIES: transcriptional regulator NanR [Ensifer]KQX51337.1 GntR family transcriptional regulator [Ensifer sp. Root1298]KQX83702.1 GntR family transcriptional regulator [Ensifer sp. Root1312]KRC20047.1 GntR family transcriptional regulator [Ensifer sp. Root74]KRD63294.1 GntR family transcriptional regulator [Ensifer sp. Root954]
MVIRHTEKPIEGLAPITRRKLSDAVFDKLKHLIEIGELKPGDEVPSERMLMESLQVGRPAVREAMQALASHGLIEISHGERSRVVPLTAKSLIKQVDIAAKMLLAGSPSNLEDLKAARLFFERGVVREAAHKATSTDIELLEAALRSQREALGQPDAFIAADMAFHTQIAKITRNSIFSAVSEAMLSWLQAFHIELLRRSGKEDITLSEHEDILEAIRSRNADLAEDALVRHLERSRDLYVTKTS